MRSLNKYFDFIRSQQCHFGGIIVDLPGFLKYCTQAWNEQLGCPVSEVSHILRRRSMRLDGEKNIGNVFPNCRRHHAWFENLEPEIRETYLPIGQMYYALFNEKVAS